MHAKGVCVVPSNRQVKPEKAGPSNPLALFGLSVSISNTNFD